MSTLDADHPARSSQEPRPLSDSAASTSDTKKAPKRPSSGQKKQPPRSAGSPSPQGTKGSSKTGGQDGRGKQARFILRQQFEKGVLRGTPTPVLCEVLEIPARTGRRWREELEARLGNEVERVHVSEAIGRIRQDAQAARELVPEWGPSAIKAALDAERLLVDLMDKRTTLAASAAESEAITDPDEALEELRRSFEIAQRGIRPTLPLLQNRVEADPDDTPPPAPAFDDPDPAQADEDPRVPIPASGPTPPPGFFRSDRCDIPMPPTPKLVPSHGPVEVIENVAGVGHMTEIVSPSAMRPAIELDAHGAPRERVSAFEATLSRPGVVRGWAPRVNFDLDDE